MWKHNTIQISGTDRDIKTVQKEKVKVNQFRRKFSTIQFRIFRLPVPDLKI